ncbi:MAG: preprotein translocase subunit SecG [Clostridia bacterium]|nr:preprotein translocase subunit SecG [Clostridia bacterium]
MKFLPMLADDLQSDFITKTFPIIRIVLFCIIIACAITMIITVLMQSNDTEGTSSNVITGSQESYYSQNKSSSRDGKLKKITIIMACVMLVCVILYMITKLING